MAPAAVLPLPGGRVYELGNAGLAPLAWMMLAWVGGGIAASMLGTLATFVLPQVVATVVTVVSISGALVGANVAYRRLSTRSRWRLHLSATETVLERRGPAPAAFDLARATTQRTRHEHATRGSRSAIPTVRIDLPDGARLVLTGPLGHGWIRLDEAEEATPGDPAGPAPDLRLADATAFAALRKRAQQ